MTVPFWCLVVAWFLVYAPRGVVIQALVKRPEGLDNVDPRTQQSKLEGLGARANAAHMNAFEGFAPFVAAVLVAHLGHGDPVWAARLAIAYCVLRAVYTGLYLGGFGSVRTAVWSLGIFCTAGLFVLPALA